MLIELYSKSSKKSRIATTAAIAVIAAICSYGWLVDPHLRLLKAVERTSAYIDMHTKKTKMITSITQIKKLDVDKLTAKVNDAQKQFFTFDTAQIFFTNLETIAAQSTCTISSLKLLSNTGDSEQKAPSPADANNFGISYHVASLSVVGTYSSIVQFLNALDNLPQKITVGGIIMSVPQDKRDRVECAMRVGIYVVDEKGAVLND